jgi:hypothetical protein
MKVPLTSRTSEPGGNRCQVAHTRRVPVDKAHRLLEHIALLMQRFNLAPQPLCVRGSILNHRENIILGRISEQPQ